MKAPVDMPIVLLSRRRRMPLGHPWNRGYPNNKFRRAAVGEAGAPEPKPPEKPHDDRRTTG